MITSTSAPTGKIFHPEWMGGNACSKTSIVAVAGAWNLWPSATPEHYDQWETARQQLDGCEVTTCNLRGHDGNGHPPHHVSIQDYADDLIAKLQQTGPAYIMGHSMAGLVTQKAENLCPDLFKGLILIASVSPKAKRVGRISFNWRFGRSQYLWAMATGRAYRLTPSDQRFVCGRASVKLGPESGRATREVVLQTIPVKPASCPVLVAVGDQDPLIPYIMQLELQRFHSADFCTVGGGGHMLHVEPESSAKLFTGINDWLEHRQP